MATGALVRVARATSAVVVGRALVLSLAATPPPDVGPPPSRVAKPSSAVIKPRCAPSATHARVPSTAAATAAAAAAAFCLQCFVQVHRRSTAAAFGTKREQLLVQVWLLVMFHRQSRVRQLVLRRRRSQRKQDG